MDKFDLSEEKLSLFLSEKQSEEIPQEIPEKNANAKKKEKAKPKPPAGKKWKDLLFQVLPCLNPALTEHLLLLNNIPPNGKCSLHDLSKLHEVLSRKINLNFL